MVLYKYCFHKNKVDIHEYQKMTQYYADFGSLGKQSPDHSYT